MQLNVRDDQVAVGSHGSAFRAPAAKAGGPGFDSRWLPWVFFLFQLAYTNAEVNGMVCGALVQFGCYQHRHE